MSRKKQRGMDPTVCADLDFKWPKFLTDRERIKDATSKYANVTLAQAFSKEYGVMLNEETMEQLVEEHINTNPVSLGRIIEVTVDSLSRNNTMLSYHNSKDLFTVRHNMSNWNVHPGDVLRATVIEKVRDGYVVDCIDPMYQDWVARVNATLPNTFQSYETTVHNLQRQKGGYTGTVEIPEVRTLTGKPYMIDAFIPGSYITLNVETDFEKWNGATIRAMITNFTNKNGKLSVVCSRKKLLNVAGGTSLVNIYDQGYCHGGEDNVPFDTMTFEGSVTGIINSSKKQGVFVEVPEFNITGMIEMNPLDLVKYHKGDLLHVQIDHFDWDPKKQPYRRDRDGILTEVNLKPIFVEVK